MISKISNVNPKLRIIVVKVIIAVVMAWLLVCGFMGCACGGRHGGAGASASSLGSEGVIYVSIAPLKYLVGRIADSTFDVRVLVPETTSPETYEPTIAQIKSLSDARGYVAVGLIDFEHSLRDGIMDIHSRGDKGGFSYVDLSAEIPSELKVAGHSHQRHSHGKDAHSHGHSGGGVGVDPHIWLSPKMLGLMANQIAGMLTELSPKDSVLYRNNLAELHVMLDSLDRSIRADFAVAGGGRGVFAIAHPSLTYYARDYGLTQLAIEVDGKEPSAGAMKEMIATLRKSGVGIVLYQKQVSGVASEVVAREVGGGCRAVEFDPLAEDVVANIGLVTALLRGGATRVGGADGQHHGKSSVTKNSGSVR